MALKRQRSDIVATESNSSSEQSQLPMGMRILLVDDCRTSRAILTMMLKRSKYRVTACTGGREALTILRHNKVAFDLVLTEVHMPEMDGFQLLQTIIPEMDVPVVLISSDQRLQTVVKGLESGACDYLPKPGRMAQYETIWKHVLRNRMLQADRAISNKKRRYVEATANKETTKKNKRMKWTHDLHNKFLAAVQHIGLDNAVPKNVLEKMDCPGLSKENVASHLQKFRAHVKKSDHQEPIQLSPETLAAVSNFVLNSADFETRPLIRNGIIIQKPSPVAIQETPQQLDMHPPPVVLEHSPPAYPKFRSISLMEIKTSHQTQVMNHGFVTEGLRDIAVMQNYQNCVSVSLVVKEASIQGQARNQCFGRESSHSQTATGKLPNLEYNLGVNEEWHQDLLNEIIASFENESDPKK